MTFLKDPPEKEEPLEPIDPAAAAEEGARNFLVVLNEIDRGNAVTECGFQMHKLITEMQQEASAQQKEVGGALTLTINIGLDERGQAEVAYAVKLKLPQRKNGRQLMFVSKGGNLTIKNPAQQELALREVVAAVKAPPREVVKNPKPKTTQQEE